MLLSGGSPSSSTIRRKLERYWRCNCSIWRNAHWRTWKRMWIERSYLPLNLNQLSHWLKTQQRKIWMESRAFLDHGVGMQKMVLQSLSSIGISNINVEPPAGRNGRFSYDGEQRNPKLVNGQHLILTSLGTIFSSEKFINVSKNLKFYVRT